MKLVYPACFYKDEKSGSYGADVPDLPGCGSGGRTFDEAAYMIIDAACGWVLGEIEEGREIPKASRTGEIQLEPDEPNGFVRMIELDMDAFCDKYGYKLPAAAVAV